MERYLKEVIYMRKLNILGLCMALSLGLMGCSDEEQPTSEAELVEIIKELQSEVSDLSEKVDNLQKSVSNLESNANILEKDWVDSASEISNNSLILQDLELEATSHLIDRFEYGVQVSSGQGMVGITSKSEISSVELKEVYFGSREDSGSNVDAPLNHLTFIYSFSGNYAGVQYDNCAVAVEMYDLYYLNNTVLFNDISLSMAYTSSESVKNHNLYAMMHEVYNNEQLK